MQKLYFIIGTVVVFFILLIIVERKASIKIILRAVLTTLILYFIYAKGVLNYTSTAILTVLVVFIVSFVNIFIKEGFHRKAFAELISVVVISMLNGVAILIICKITGTVISYQDGNLSEETNINGMEFAISVVAMLGIFMDIISRIVVKLDDEKNKTKDVTWIEQFKEGMEIGRILISEKINMLFLMFAGITLFPICLYIANGYNLQDIVSVDYVFFSCIVAFIGNIGLVLSVPITSITYAILNRKKTIYKTTSDNKLEGKRSLKL